MQFEYDKHKSDINRTKHGVDFEEAKLVWGDDDLVIVESPYTDEPRSLAIGRIYNKIWTVIFTRRNEKIRIISARRSRESEVSFYDKQKNN